MISAPWLTTRRSSSEGLETKRTSLRQTQADSERHRARRWVGIALSTGVVAAAVIAGRLMNLVSHGPGFADGVLVGLVLGGGFGLVGWAVLTSDGSHRWRMGALGEEMTWVELRKLGRDWTVLNSLCIPGADGTTREVDHVAIGPPGVLVIDSKLWTSNHTSLSRLSTSLDLDIRGVQRQAGVVRLNLGQNQSSSEAARRIIGNLMVWGPEVDSAASGVRFD